MKPEKPEWTFESIFFWGVLGISLLCNFVYMQNELYFEVNMKKLKKEYEQKVTPDKLKYWENIEYEQRVKINHLELNLETRERELRQCEENKK